MEWIAIIAQSYRLTGVTATRYSSRTCRRSVFPSREETHADRRDRRTGAQLSSSRDRRDERAGAHLPLLRETGWMCEGARTDVGPLSRFLDVAARLGFGAWAVGGNGWGAAGDAGERAAAIRHAVERGVTFFDTAPTYGGGESERLLGRVLKGERERVAIATKVGPRHDPRASLEDSLRRLGTDYVDLVQLHETLERWEWQLEKLHALQLAGKALAVGLCNATHLQLERALTIAPLATYQAAYNLFDRDVEERELPLCRDRDLAFLAYRPLAAGLLTGKYTAPPAPPPPQFAEGDHRRQIYWFKGREFERRRCVIEGVQPIAEREALTLIGLALRCLRARPAVAVVLAGAEYAG